MGEFQITPIDGSLVALVLLLTQTFKGQVRERWIPVIPVVFSFGLAAVAILAERGWPGWVVFASATLLEGLKVAALSMSSFKLWKTTVQGR